MIGGDIGAMMARHGRDGSVEALFTRPKRREPVIIHTSVDVGLEGLSGDHSAAVKRAVTLIQSEHIPVIAAFLNGVDLQPDALRRNIVVSGINLLGLRKAHIQIGNCVLFIHGPCPPCSRMEEALGPGGYSAVRGHGGVYAEVIEPGEISVGSAIMRSERPSI